MLCLSGGKSTCFSIALRGEGVYFYLQNGKMCDIKQRAHAGGKWVWKAFKLYLKSHVLEETNSCKKNTSLKWASPLRILPFNLMFWIAYFFRVACWNGERSAALEFYLSLCFLFVIKCKWITLAESVHFKQAEKLRLVMWFMPC